MPSEKIQEALSHLQDDWPLRVILSALAEGVAELAALLGQAEAQKLPPEFLTRESGPSRRRCTSFPVYAKPHRYHQRMPKEETSMICRSSRD